MKIAVTYDNGQVGQHFGRTEAFKIYDIEDNAVVSAEVVPTGEYSHGALAGFLADLGVNAIIFGGAGQPMVNRLESFGITPYPGVSGDADQAVNDLIAGNLTINEAAVHGACHHHHHDA